SQDTLIHLGSDLLRVSDGGQGSVRLGVMGAFGRSEGKSEGGYSTARSSVQGYSGGVYGTWFGQEDARTGPYVDSWVMFGSYRNRVDGDGLPTEHYRSRELSTSLEGGYAWSFEGTAGARYLVVPQAQVIWSDYRASDHTEQTGTVVREISDRTVTTRVGLRWEQTAATLADGVTPLQPFAELNWWHGPGSHRMVFDGDVVTEALPANRGELRLGARGEVAKDVSVWLTLGAEVGGQDYVRGSAQVGVKTRW
ncbi:autotransporter outer membrane beta-barrel domain-containing protein, partial [Chitiniphilus shinanonensis]|uniref:autotransporter outer membrane beta-barrel domain-containing protein n=1 Tax=Chitiniphilus shinanonensis TaxID=553088 RepID=UPI0024E14972